MRLEEASFFFSVGVVCLSVVCGDGEMIGRLLQFDFSVTLCLNVSHFDFSLCPAVLRILRTEL